MIGADIVVAFFDKDQKAFKAVDYHMSKYSQVCVNFPHFSTRIVLQSTFLLSSVTASRECVQTSASVAKTTPESCSGRIAMA